MGELSNVVIETKLASFYPSPRFLTGRKIKCPRGDFIMKRTLLCMALATAALTAAPALAETQQTIIRADGSKVVIIHRGGEFGDGFYDASHNWVRVDANGKVIVEHPNGSETVTQPDGTRIHTNAEGDRTVRTNPDGSRVITQREQ
jgi:hypothetical protein